MRATLLSLLVLGLCSSCVPGTATPPTISSKDAATPGADTVIATVGDRQIRLKELDEQAAAELHELEEQRYQIRRQALEQMVNQELLRKEAKNTGISEANYLKNEVENKIKPPSDKDIEEFFNKNAAQLPKDAKIADYKDRIAVFLKRQGHQDRAKEIFANLRQKAQVVVTLAPPAKPRLQVEAKGPSMGPENAKVTLLEFSDFECPFCARAKETVDKVMHKYGDKVKLVFRHYPLSFHPHARKAAEAAACAGLQQKFWPFYDALYSNQSKLSLEDLRKVAVKLELSLDKYDSCLSKGGGAKIVDADTVVAEQAGVKGTPAFFINGISLSGAQPIEQFEQIIDQELKN